MSGAQAGDSALAHEALAPDLPKGEQIRQIIESMCEDLGPGAALPSERLVAVRYGVARMTARAEFRRLAADGIISVRPGAGAFVADSAPLPSIVGSSFSHDMRARNRLPGALVVEHTVFRASSRVAALLEVAEGSPALRVVRVRTADGEPLALERTTLSLARFPGLDRVDLNGASLYDTLLGRWRVRTSSVTATAQAVLPSADEAAALGMATAEPCLRITSLQRDAAGEVVESGRSIYRGGGYELDVSCRRSS